VLRLLVVDDEPNIRAGLAEALARPELSIEAVASGAEALARLEREPAEIVVTDLRMPGPIDGLAVLDRARALVPECAVILVTAYGTVDVAVDAMKRGALDFVTKPVNLQHLRAIVARAIDRWSLLLQNRRMRGELRAPLPRSAVVSESPRMRSVAALVAQVAASDATILLQGESGTGKEVIAREIHARSPRAGGPFVPIHCGAIPEALLPSELFGHEAGAFTGAVARRRGAFEVASGGTLLLDEVSEIPLASQVDLLRVLEERVIQRLGAERRVPANVRIIAASNVDLARRVKEGRFREDLFYRLAVVPIALPPLRERAEDIPALAASFLSEFAALHGRRETRLTPEAVEVLRRYPFPGNIRELRNLCERLALTAPSPSIGPEDLPFAIHASAGAAPGPSEPTLRQAVERAEREAIAAALRATGGHRAKAAEMLGVSVRTLHYKLRIHGIV
jgi:two-component system NtrC family response regulator